MVPARARAGGSDGRGGRVLSQHGPGAGRCAAAGRRRDAAGRMAGPGPGRLPARSLGSRGGPACALPGGGRLPAGRSAGATGAGHPAGPGGARCPRLAWARGYGFAGCPVTMRLVRLTLAVPANRSAENFVSSRRCFLPLGAPRLANSVEVKGHYLILIWTEFAQVGELRPDQDQVVPLDLGHLDACSLGEVTG